MPGSPSGTEETAGEAGDAGAPEQSSAADVVVTAAHCSEEAARVLLDVLERAFPVSAAEGVAVEPGPHGKATVWCTTVNAAENAAEKAAETASGSARTAPQDGVSLDGTVLVGLQGGPRAVDRVVAALKDAFAVDERGTVAGDQEKEVDLLIRSA
ncbi:hypothetical protein ACF059_04280 [Streptomyces sp. NPDC016562]|uniref:hypothetical protein n=1 Tax=Streptomyces sp. NPDC016562 TaxID=3364966 RepID=UPI0036FC3C47